MADLNYLVDVDGQERQHEDIPNHPPNFSHAASVFQTSFYIDDCLTGADNLTDAIQLELISTSC